MNAGFVGRAPLRIAAALLWGAASAACIAQDAIHSGPLPTYAGTGDRVRCMVVNVGGDTLFNVHVVIRSANFGTVLAETTCSTLPPRADCGAAFTVAGPGLFVTTYCSADAPGRGETSTTLREALRGTFLRTSVLDRSMDVAVEMR